MTDIIKSLRGVYNEQRTLKKDCKGTERCCQLRLSRYQHLIR